VPVVRRPDYTIYLERAYGREWLHIDVTRWTASVKRQIKTDMDALMRLHGGPIYALNSPNGFAKRERFMQMIGLQWDCAHEADGKTHQIYARY